MTVDAHEFDALTVHMQAGLSRVGRGGARIVRRTTLKCEGLARLGAPVRTGYLQNSIGSEFFGDGRSGEAAGEVTAHAGYARWVEEGTSRMGPQPFMRPALRAVTPSMVAAAARLGGSLLDRGGS